MHSLPQSLKSFFLQEDGPTAVEYAVMLAFIITVCVSAINSLGSTTNRSFNSASKGLTASSS